MGAAPEWDGAKPRTDLVGDSRNWPPGFRFHPTDEELVFYYLKRKLYRRRISLPIIGEVDVYKWEPWELPEKSVVRSGDKQWYFFSPRDRKYPNGSRSNRSTRRGYWKATGKDRTISTTGNKKTLVYYHGRPPKGERTDWVMHEYTLDEQTLSHDRVHDPYALYKVFRKSGPGPKNGEEYGAPFREEEWDDDDDCFRKDDHGKTIAKNPTIHFDGDTSVENHVAINDSDLPEIPLDSGCTSAHALEVEYAADVVESHILWQNCEQVSIAMSSNIPPPPQMESLVEGELVDDFLEMKDFNDTDGLYDPYDYFDADMYLAEAMKPVVDGVTSDMYFDVFEDYGETQEQASDMISELWTHEQPLLEGVSPTSGATGCNATISNTMGEMSEGGNVSETWFSTALSALLDSIPSSPAIASENPMIVRAFERVSSFKLGKSTTTTTTATGRRPVTHTGGLLFISFLVMIGAILWVLSIGAALKGLKCLWGRFV